MIGGAVSPTVDVPLHAGVASTGTTTFVLAGALVVLGIAMVLLAIWLVRATRSDPPALAPLEVMGHRHWRRGDADAREALVTAARPEDALPPAPMLDYEAVDYEGALKSLATAEAEEANRAVVATGTELSVDAAAAASVDDGVAPAEGSSSPMPDATVETSVDESDLPAEAAPVGTADEPEESEIVTDETSLQSDLAALAAEAVEEESAVETVTEADAAAAAVAVVDDEAHEDQVDHGAPDAGQDAAVAAAEGVEEDSAVETVSEAAAAATAIAAADADAEQTNEHDGEPEVEVEADVDVVAAEVVAAPRRSGRVSALVGKIRRRS